MTKKYLKTVLTSFIAVLFAQINYSQTVTICTQVWTSMNLDVTTFRNGDQIPEAKTAEEWENADYNKQPAWCYYDNDPSNGTKYGKLYNWYAVNDPRGLAPIGYHIPSEEEWTILSVYLGGKGVAGGKMKTKSGWDAPNTGASNSSGFGGLPGGCRSGFGKFVGIGGLAYWWTSTEFDTSTAYDYSLHCFDGTVRRYTYYKRDGFSVRCLRD
jgi:uncharacterized protein (TIGR02145 family)